MNRKTKGRIRKLEKLFRINRTLKEELADMTDQELEERIMELDPGFLEMSPEEQTKSLTELGRELAASGQLPVS
jgi:hypothetical protein